MQTIKETSPWMSLEEAVEYTGVGDQTLRKHIHKGKLKACRAGTVLIRVHRDELDRWLKSQPAKGPTDVRNGCRLGKKTGPRPK
ncbi:MAG: helix-turn-helix domain-containing protein [Planctomycetes bacterium]|nr:helix-turn-helix domain-containing protein [Planctomycetota bacterium]